MAWNPDSLGISIVYSLYLSAATLSGITVLDKSSFPLLLSRAGGAMSDIFISYSREDSQFVEALIMALINYGWSVWSDKIAISEGRPYDEQTEHAIGEATVTLVIWSQASVKSRWVRAEAAYALQRDKLVPVIAEDVDPPLQFLHIQALNLVDWDKTNDDLYFKRLAVALSGRLDRVGRNIQAEPKALVKLDASPPAGILALHKKLFPAVSRGFDEYFTNRTFYIAQFACGLAVCLVTIFGLIDLLSHASAGHTVFRSLVEAPTFLLLLAFSFTPLAKRNAQTFALTFGIIALLIIFISSQRVESTYPVTTGAATTTFMVALAVFTVLPLKTPHAAILGVLTLVTHHIYIMWTHTPINPGLQAGYSICVLSATLALVAVAYFRERLMRNSFLDNERATAKIAELRERLMTLAVQQKQTRNRSSNKHVREKSMLGPSE
jgi:TIR domain